jgi:hypothetical protein
MSLVALISLDHDDLDAGIAGEGHHIRGQTSRQSRRSCDVTMHGNGRAVRARGQWSPELRQ